MRIGFYTPNYPGLTTDGGIGSYTRTLGRGLAEAGHEVHVLTPGDKPAASDGPVRVHFVRTDHVPGVDRLLPGAGACWRTARALRRLVRDRRLDVVEVANWEGYGLLYMHLPRVPTVVRLYTSSRETQQIDGLVASRWLAWDVKRERWQARTADALVTHSDAHRRLMAEEVGVPPDRIRLIPLGIPVFPAFVRPLLPPGPPTVVYLGRLEHRKGTVELLQAIPKVLDAVPDAQFVLIGADRPHCPDGRTHAQFLEQDFPPEVRRHVTLTGKLPQPDVDRWLQTADLFVAPSRYESFGLIFLEAMRWGTPVVGTTAGGIPEVVEDGQSGVLVRPEAPNELATAVVGLLRDPGQRAALGAEGRRRAEREFSVERMASRVTALYEDLRAARRADRPTRRVRYVH
ncbi:MAG TPA: glycosyltransferase family 4 protein [Fimbriiglobus sp.]|nr:glycosyltransferase family 4 protein [Fimbriiglobus sp.]